MQDSIYFYDLETSGLSTRTDRIMQFAGIRTDLELNPIGEPDNILVKVDDDTIPSVGALMTTGITPQATQVDGVSEREFCEYFNERIATPGTVLMGFNTVRYDDRMMQATLWRNFYDPYEWQWKDRRSKWDMLDVVRLVRALRPEGIKWPVDEEGKPVNRLELITKENRIEHEHAHDALSDVYATLAVARLIRKQQPEMYEWLFKMRHKKNVQKLVNLEDPKPFVYASGRYGKEYNFTTVAFPIAPGKNNNSVLVYDLRYDPEEVIREQKFYPVVKELRYNSCPAVAPMGVLNKADGWNKLALSEEQIHQNLEKLTKHPEIANLAIEASEQKFAEREAELGSDDSAEEAVKGIRVVGDEKTEQTADEIWKKQAGIRKQLEFDAESRLFDGFLNDKDRRACELVRNNDQESLAKFTPEFDDGRLDELFLHYKAKNFPEILGEADRKKWQEYRKKRLSLQYELMQMEMTELQKDLAGVEEYKGRSLADCEYLIEELNLWVQSLQETEE